MRNSRELDGILIRLYVMTHSIRPQHGIRAGAVPIRLDIMTHAGKLPVLALLAAVPMRLCTMTHALRHAQSFRSPELVRRLTT